MGEEMGDAEGIRVPRRRSYRCSSGRCSRGALPSGQINISWRDQRTSPAPAVTNRPRRVRPNRAAWALALDTDQRKASGQVRYPRSGFPIDLPPSRVGAEAANTANEGENRAKAKSQPVPVRIKTGLN